MAHFLHLVVVVGKGEVDPQVLEYELYEAADLFDYFKFLGEVSQEKALEFAREVVERYRKLKLEIGRLPVSRAVESPAYINVLEMVTLYQGSIHAPTDLVWVKDGSELRPLSVPELEKGLPEGKYLMFDSHW